MTHTEQDLTIYQGQTASIVITIYASESSNTPQPITGWALEATFAPVNSGAVDADFTKTIGAGLTITDGANGVVTLVLPNEDTAEMNGEYEYSLWVIDANAEAPLTIGTISIRETARSRSSS